MRRYLFVFLSVLSVGIGIVFLNLNNVLGANLAWSFGAVIGFVFSARWLISSLRRKNLGSDVLALVAIIATVATGEFLAASIISLMLATGQALETWAEGRSSRQLDALLSRAPSKANLITNGNQILEVPINEVTIGSKVLVRSGEVVPFDGILLSDSVLDEAALTGESLPVIRATGEQVNSGVVNAGESVVVQTTASGEDSTYANLIRLVTDAKNKASAGVRIANVWAKRFVPVAFLIAFATFIFSGDVKQAVSVIVAATPCPLILAVPIALVSGISRAAKHGVIIKVGEAIEKLAKTEVVLLDKTGTLTAGNAGVMEMVFKNPADKNEVLTYAASLEQHSPNLVGKAIVALAKDLGLELLNVESSSEVHGHGLSGIVAGKAIALGQPKSELPDWAILTCPLLVEITIGNEVVGYLGLSDPLRPESIATIDALRSHGVKRILLVSGDRKVTVEKIANELGISEFFAESSPSQKLQILQDEKNAAKGSVIVVGDGINDAPALAAADVGVAMGARGNTAASQAASVVIIEDSIRRLVDAIAISKVARNRALQASGIGMGLALLAMGVAAFGFVTASESAIIQEFIDAASILWALAPSTKSGQPKQ